MKNFFFAGFIGLVGLIGFTGPLATAQTVSQEQARAVATTFWNSYRPVEVKAATTIAPLPFTELAHMHVFSINSDGFVIVAGDERARPVLAYSFDSPFPEELNPEVGYWLRGYEAQLADVAKSDAIQNEKVKRSWMQLLSAPSPEEPVGSLQDIPALMATRWNQDRPYNNLCPFDSARNARTVVGCVATAMAQIMRYWEYPAYGEGSHTYSYHQHRDISADFGNTSYLWHIMPNICNEYSQESQINATATISYHCGVGVEMMYGTAGEGGSGAYSSCGPWASHCASSAFINYFKYDSSLYNASRASYTDAEWTALLDNEIEHHRPIYYSGHDTSGGHAFVLDGSDLEGRYHVNWGWGGSADGFYYVDTLAPGYFGIGTNITSSFNFDQGAIFGIQPAYTETFDTVDYPDSVCENTQYVYFRDYKLVVYNVKDHDTLLHHLDTVFRYHLKVIQKKKVYLNPNNGGISDMRTYCPATGFTLPECHYTKTGCVFTGWCRNRDGNDVIYQPGETAYFNNTPTFYALWLDTTAAVGIDESSILNSLFSIYPNPTTGEITLTVPAETGTILVTDAVGRVVLRDDYPNLIGGHAKISLARLPSGTYSIVVKTSAGIFKQQVIKQ
jgi:hypothetical protein